MEAVPVGRVVGIILSALVVAAALLQGVEALLNLLARRRRPPVDARQSRRRKMDRPTEATLVAFRLTQQGIDRFVTWIMGVGIVLVSIPVLNSFYDHFSLDLRISAMVAYLGFLYYFPLALAKRGHKLVLALVAIPVIVEVTWAFVVYFQPQLRQAVWYAAAFRSVHGICFALFHTGLVLYVSLEYAIPWMRRFPEA